MYDLYIMPARKISDSHDLTHDSLSQYGNFIYHFIEQNACSPDTFTSAGSNGY